MNNTERYQQLVDDVQGNIKELIHVYPLASVARDGGNAISIAKKINESFIAVGPITASFAESGLTNIPVSPNWESDTPLTPGGKYFSFFTQDEGGLAILKTLVELMTGKVNHLGLLYMQTIPNENGDTIVLDLGLLAGMELVRLYEYPYNWRVQAAAYGNDIRWRNAGILVEFKSDPSVATSTALRQELGQRLTDDDLSPYEIVKIIQNHLHKVG